MSYLIVPGLVRTVPACEETQQGCPEGAAGEAVDDEVDARVEHEEKVVDAGERERGDSIHSDLVLHCTQQHEDNEMIPLHCIRIFLYFQFQSNPW